MVDRPSTLRIELPTDTALLRRVARLLEREQQWSALDSVLVALLELAPRGWRAHLWRHDAMAAANDESGHKAAIHDVVAIALADAPAIQSLLRVLDSTGRVEYAKALLDAIFERDPSNWRMALRYACTLEDMGDMDSARGILARLFAKDGSLTAASQKAAFGELAAKGRTRLLAHAMLAVSDLRPEDWKLRLRAASARSDAGDTVSAARVVGDLFADPARTAAERKIMFGVLVWQKGIDLIAAALAGHGVVDHKGLVALLSNWKEREALPDLRQALLVPGAIGRTCCYWRSPDPWKGSAKGKWPTKRSGRSSRSSTRSRHRTQPARPPAR